MSVERRDPIEAWAELSARAARASVGRATATRAIWTDGPRRPAAAAAGAGLLTVAVVVVGVALALRPAAAPAASDAVASGATSGAASPTGSPVLASTSDASFRLDLAVPSSRFTTVDEIEPVATLTWIGPDATKTVFHAATPILFRIEEVGGSRVMDGGMDLPCLSTMFTAGAGKTYPFEKSGSPTDDPAAGFDRAWYEDPVLRLPPGQWRITAQLDVTLGGCGADAERHQLTTSAEVTVSAAAASAEPVRAATDDGMFRLSLTTPHGVYGPSDAIEPVATVSYLGPTAETSIYHGGSPVQFSIEEVGGPRRMDGGMTAPCLTTIVDQAEPLTFPFVKSGAIGEWFDMAWFTDPVLRLPVGTWRIRVQLIVETTNGTDTCGGIAHPLDVDNVIQVVDPASAPSAAATLTPTPPASPTPPPATPRPSGQPVSEDGSFRLEIAIPGDAFTTDDAIEPVATLTYLGPLDLVEYGHSDPALFFTIEQLDGDAQMTGGAADSCTLTTIGRDEPVQVRFHKGGSLDYGFDEAWMRDPVLHLPPGTWLVTAWFEGGIPACEAGGVIHALRADKVISVR